MLDRLLFGFAFFILGVGLVTGSIAKHPYWYGALAIAAVLWVVFGSRGK